MCGCDANLNLFVPTGGIRGGGLNCWAVCCCYKCKPLAASPLGYTSNGCWTGFTAFYLIVAVLWTLGFGFGSWAVWAQYEEGGCTGVTKDKVDYHFDCTPTNGSQVDPDFDGSLCCTLNCTRPATKCEWVEPDPVFTVVVVSILAAMAAVGVLMIISGSMICVFKKQLDQGQPVEPAKKTRANDDGHYTTY